MRDPSRVLAELLGEAGEASQRKAQRLAAAAERSLGRIVAVEEGVRDGRGDEGGIRLLSAGAAAPDVDLRPGESTLTATVRVTFAIE